MALSPLAHATTGRMLCPSRKSVDPNEPKMSWMFPPGRSVMNSIWLSNRENAGSESGRGLSMTPLSAVTRQFP
jgi:hypothetical protein